MINKAKALFIMLIRNEMSLKALCEKEGATQLEWFDFIGKDGKKHRFYSLGSIKVIWASDRAVVLLTEGQAALEKGNIEIAAECFRNIKYAECKKEDLPDFDKQGRSNWVPSLMICNPQQRTSVYQNAFVKRNEMSYWTLCEKEGTTELKDFEFVDKNGKKHIFYSLGSKNVIYAFNGVQQAVEEGKYNAIQYAEFKKKEQPDINEKGTSNWIPSLFVKKHTAIMLPFNGVNKSQSLGSFYEKGTLYAHKINKLRYFSFSNIRSVSIWFLQDYSDEEKEKLKQEIKRGEVVLSTYEQLHAYMYCFGLMHEAKLQRAFREIPQHFLYSEIEVIDYACGQGIASVCFANFIKDTNSSTVIKKITLIEPSNIALSRASLLCRKICPNASIETINYDFDSLGHNHFFLTNMRKVHLLSNILDMTCYDLNHLARVINKMKIPGDIFVCVDPYYHDVKKDGRQQKLMRLLDGKEIYHKAFNDYELQMDKSWTANITIFTV